MFRTPVPRMFHSPVWNQSNSSDRVCRVKNEPPLNWNKTRRKNLFQDPDIFASIADSFSQISSAYSSSSEEAEEEEPPEIFQRIAENGIVSSPVSTDVYYSYIFRTTNLADYYNILSERSISNHPSVRVSTTVPWHVGKGGSFIIDLKKLENVADLTHDCWWWKHLGTYVIVSDDEGETFRKQSTGHS